MIEDPEAKILMYLWNSHPYLFLWEHLEFIAKLMLKGNPSKFNFLLESKTTHQLFFRLTFEERKGFIERLLHDEELFPLFKENLLKSPFSSFLFYESLPDIL